MKRLDLTIPMCGACPYLVVGTSPATCYQKRSLKIRNFGIIHQDCPLPDAPEEPTAAQRVLDGDHYYQPYRLNGADSIQKTECRINRWKGTQKT